VTTPPVCPGFMPRYEILDFSIDKHLQAWSLSEAEREFNCWMIGSDFEPRNSEFWLYYDGRIAPWPDDIAFARTPSGIVQNPWHIDGTVDR
jgi:hypothetical protein